MTEFLDWQSKLSLQTVFAGFEQQAYPHLWDKGILYLSALRADQGRMVVIYRHGDNQICVTPQAFNLRTKFSEYGGKPFWIDGERLYFVNQADQCLYQQTLPRSDSTPSSLPGLPKRVSPLADRSGSLMYADVICVSPGSLLAIVEQEPPRATGACETSSLENKSFIAAIDLDNPDAAPRELMQGADFYSNLCFDAVNQRLAWVQWNHPNMPWDETQLWVAEFENSGTDISLINARCIQLSGSASVCQLLFANNGRLFFSADFIGADNDSSRNYWNIYALDPALQETTVVQVTHGKQEFGYPHWQYGDARIAMLDANTLLSYASGTAGDTLYRIDQDSLQVQELDQTGNGYQNLWSDGSGSAVAIMLSAQAPSSPAVLEAGHQCFRSLVKVPAPLAAADISVAEHFEFPTRDGSIAYGFYYAPTNAAYTTAAQSAGSPPLLVMVHGGPTAGAHGFFDLQKQFWTQRGFAIFDVNHRGSSGYGRAYRDALYGHWGETDMHDIVDGVEYLVGLGKAAPDRVCIRGKSAGGYAVLRALTECPGIFRAGACYYGIGNLATLAETTHKFEKHYTDRLIGEAYDADTALTASSVFQQRSPINKIGQLRSAMIVFQGLQDKVVPPALAHEIIDALKSLGLEHSYVEYADEGHGFRQAANNIDAWSRELQFYRENLK